MHRVTKNDWLLYALYQPKTNAYCGPITNTFQVTLLKVIGFGVGLKIFILTFVVVTWSGIITAL